MARRRMLSLDVIDTDLFLDMSAGAQNLYFHLAIRADDDGFISAPRKIIKMTNAADDDMKILCAKGFVIPFDTGVCVIKHWKIHNLIRADRYTETQCKKEKETLIQIDKKYEFTGEIGNVIPRDNQMEPQVRVGKVRVGKVREDNKRAPSFKKPTIEEITEYCKERKNGVNADTFFNYYETSNWFRGTTKIKDWKACVRTWERRDKKENINYDKY